MSTFPIENFLILSFILIIYFCCHVSVGPISLYISMPKILGVTLALHIWKSCVFLRIVLSKRMDLSVMEIWKLALSTALCNHYVTLSPTCLEDLPDLKNKSFDSAYLYLQNLGGLEALCLHHNELIFQILCKWIKLMQICDRIFPTKIKMESMLNLFNS